MSIFED